jgi:putative flippase GtrA
MQDNFVIRIIKTSKLLINKFSNQFKKYIFTGLLAFTLEYLTFYIILMYYSKFIANSVGMFVGFWISFLLNKFWSFEAKGKFFNQLFRYLVLFTINLFISNFLIYVLSDILNITPLISKIITMCLIVFWNYFIFKNLIYKVKKDDK